MKYMSTLAYLAGVITAFPLVAKLDGVQNTQMLRRQQSGGYQPGEPETCPFNPNHVDAVPANSQFPYNSAINSSQGKGMGRYLVPAPGDTAPQFIAPTSMDIRGPCPDPNAAANNGFIARDGITTYTELLVLLSPLAHSQKKVLQAQHASILIVNHI